MFCTFLKSLWFLFHPVSDLQNLFLLIRLNKRTKFRIRYSFLCVHKYFITSLTSTECYVLSRILICLLHSYWCVLDLFYFWNSAMVTSLTWQKPDVTAKLEDVEAELQVAGVIKAVSTRVTSLEKQVALVFWQYIPDWGLQDCQWIKDNYIISFLQWSHHFCLTS